MTDAMFALTLALLLVAPLTIAGIALINTGLGRSRSAAQSLLETWRLWLLPRLSLRGGCGVGGLGWVDGAYLSAGRKPWNWLGAGPLLLGGFGSAAPQTQLALLFEFLAVALAALVPWGSGADRWRLTAGCASAACWPQLSSPCWRTGFGAAAGWRNWRELRLGAGFQDGGGG